jgi:hypothetical protein
LYGVVTLNQNIDSRKRKYLIVPQVALEQLQICRILCSGESIRRIRLACRDVRQSFDACLQFRCIQSPLAAPRNANCEAWQRRACNRRGPLKGRADVFTVE